MNTKPLIGLTNFTTLFIYFISIVMGKKNFSP